MDDLGAKMFDGACDDGIYEDWESWKCNDDRAWWREEEKEVNDDGG